MQREAAGQDKTECELIRRKTVGIISGDWASDASALLYWKKKKKEMCQKTKAADYDRKSVLQRWKKHCMMLTNSA